MDRSAAAVAARRDWTTEAFSDYRLMCCGRPHLSLMGDAFSLSQRVAGIGPAVLADLAINADLSMDCKGLCGTYYRVLLVQTGCTESVFRGTSVTAGPGTAAVYAPEGDGATRWAAGTRMTFQGRPACH
jgi:hypothetical protein